MFHQLLREINLPRFFGLGGLAGWNEQVAPILRSRTWREFREDQLDALLTEKKNRRKKKTRTLFNKTRKRVSQIARENRSLDRDTSVINGFINLSRNELFCAHF